MKKLMMAAIAVCAAVAQAVAERSEESFADLPEGYVRLEYACCIIPAPPRSCTSPSQA